MVGVTYHKNRIECGRNMPSFFSIASFCISHIGQLCSRRQPLRQPRSVVGMDHILSTEEERQGGKEAYPEQLISGPLSKVSITDVPKELNYYTTTPVFLA